MGRAFKPIWVHMCRIWAQIWPEGHPPHWKWIAKTQKAFFWISNASVCNSEQIHTVTWARVLHIDFVLFKVLFQFFSCFSASKWFSLAESCRGIQIHCCLWLRIRSKALDNQPISSFHWETQVLEEVGLGRHGPIRQGKPIKVDFSSTRIEILNAYRLLGKNEISRNMSGSSQKLCCFEKQYDESPMRTNLWKLN